MAWEVFILNGAAEIMALIILLISLLFSFWLMKGDEQIKWNLMIVAISFLAFSIIFDLLNLYLSVALFSFLENFFMAFSAWIFASILFIYTREHPSTKK